MLFRSGMRLREAILAGADMINDINGFRAPGAIEAVKDSDCALCIMHMQNVPETMQAQPHYEDVVREVIAFLRERVETMTAAGIDREHLTQWCDEHGWQVVLNRAGTTFRKLEDERKADLDQSKAIELMLAQPSMIKRPVLDLGDRTLIGFKPDSYSAALK